LLRDDVADSLRLRLAVPPARGLDGGPLRIGWLTTPPAGGSGGHTTMFRMVEGLERAGHGCVLLTYDRHHGRVEDQAAAIRAWWPQVRAGVRSVDEGMDGLDAVVATGWETAHVLATRGTRAMHRFYFIQDFEPFFYPHGSEYELASDTYRFGFTNIALGHMVHHRLETELGVPSVMVPFSCDSTVYRLGPAVPRSGVVAYAKPNVPRRGYRLAAAALEEFHERRPDQPIHVYGSHDIDIRVPVTHHGTVSPQDLNRLYNGARAGLAMSCTNISLVAEEMLAAGCLPVVNDSQDARADLPNPEVEWAHPTPGGLADALCRAVDGASDARSRSAAAATRKDNWGTAAAEVTRLIERQVVGPRRMPAGALTPVPEAS
jgi:glycosyltransferase involved in cell wall biosynthesis